MSEEKKIDEESTKTLLQNPQVRKVVIVAAVLIVVFLLGLIPMWLTARDRGARLAETQRELKLAQLQNTIGSGVIDARRGEYELARQSASDFFTTLRAEIGRENESALTQAQRAGITPLLTERDEIITLLARNDPASAERLSDLYVAYSNAIKGL
jgi:hypothetical protein